MTRKLPVAVILAISLLTGCGAAGTVSSVSSPASRPASQAPAPQPQQTLAPVGDLPGWHQVFVENFSTPAPLGSFPGKAYPDCSVYSGFRDSSGLGMYEPAKVLSVHDGLLDWHLWTDDGQPLAGAVVPDNYSGQIYGRYSVRFRSGNAPGYGFAFLLWPDDNNPDEGEIDYPETSLAPGSTVNAYVHVIGSDPGKNYYRFRTDVSADTGFHIATIEWQPGRITFILDGKIIGVATKDVPSTPFHWVLQAGANYSLPAPGISGHIYVDWVTIYSYEGAR